MRTILLFAFILQCTFIAFSQTPSYSETGLEWNSKDIEILVEHLPDNARSIGLTADRIQTKCESRLRQAGLNIVDESSHLPIFLYVSVNLFGNSFNIDLHFNRIVNYLSGGDKMYWKYAATWHTSMTGTSDNAEYILQSLDGQLDKFLNDYLKANPSLSGSK